MHAQNLPGLPGNPVSALMTYVVYIHSIVGVIQGKLNKLHMVKSVLKSPILNRSSRDTFFRVKFDNEEKKWCESAEHQGSHMIMSLVNSHGFIKVKGNEELSADCEVEVLLFPWTN